MKNFFMCLRTKSRLPAISEHGGKIPKKQIGTARIICGKDGGKLKPIFMHRKVKPCDDAAIFVAFPGMYIITVNYRDANMQKEIHLITKVPDREDKDDSLTTELVWSSSEEFQTDTGGREMPSKFKEPMEAAELRARSEEALTALFAVR